MTLNGGYSYRHVLGPEASGHTAHSYLVHRFSHSTSEEWRTRLESGEILVADRIADESHPLRPGQILIWNRPPWKEGDTPREFGVVYQDQNLLAVDKPSGLPTLPGGGFYLNTLLSLVRMNFPGARPLHRLGRGTSGLVLFALDSDTASKMGRSWTKVQKQYQALGSSVASQDSYDIRCPIGGEKHPRLGRVYAASPAGKAARSVARVLERRLGSTLFEVDLLTGRPHQIRIHLAWIGHPLVGDPLYAAGGLPKREQPGLPGDTGYSLHANRLSFEHPWLAKVMVLTSPLPEELRAFTARMSYSSRASR